MPFQIHALEPGQFLPLFEMPDAELARRNARRETVRSCPGTPCRISLEDAKAGEEVIGLNYEHQPADSPYKSSHAIFIRRGVEQAFPGVNEIPKLFRHRLMSVRAFSRDHLLVDAEAVAGAGLEAVIEGFFGNPEVAYIHLHYAKPGCFAASVTRE